MARSRTVVFASALAVIALIALWAPASARASVIEMASVDSMEVQAALGSYWPSISADGRWVVFRSGADNLLPGDENHAADIFVRDRLVGTTEIVSVATGGAAADANSGSCDISADGRYVVFWSAATNLVADDTNGKSDVFVRDRVAGTTVRVSVSSTGTQSDQVSWYPHISADGRYVTFSSDATNLVDNDTNGVTDAFRYDLQTGTMERVSVDSAGTQGDGWCFETRISADGRYVAFESVAGNLVSGDTNLKDDIFLRDCQTGETVRVSVGTGGVQANGDSDDMSLSADGRYIAFESKATNLVASDTNSAYDIFVHDTQIGTTSCASLKAGGGVAGDWSMRPSISGDGRFVTFRSIATDHVAGDTNGYVDIFVRDRKAGITAKVSVGTYGAQADSESDGAVISADGRFVTFYSGATNLLPTPDTNAASDIFVANVRAYSSIRGIHRYETAQLISQAMFPQALPPDSGCVVASGETFQGALVGAPLAAAYGGPVLLTPTVGLENGTRDELVRLQPDTVFVIGLPPDIAGAIEDALPGGAVIVISGVDLYDMSALVANALEGRLGDAGSLSDATAIITIATNFPDAIGVSPLACANLWPILLTDKPDGSPLHPLSAQSLSELGITKALKVGTYAELPEEVAGVGNPSGADRYYTNGNLANWGKNHGGLTFEYLGMATGDKFPDALASGPYLAQHQGTLLLSPLLGPVPPAISTVIAANSIAVHDVTFIACIQPVIGQVKALLP